MRNFLLGIRKKKLKKLRNLLKHWSCMNVRPRRGPIVLPRRKKKQNKC